MNNNIQYVKPSESAFYPPPRPHGFRFTACRGMTLAAARILLSGRAVLGAGIRRWPSCGEGKGPPAWRIKSKPVSVHHTQFRRFRCHARIYIDWQQWYNCAQGCHAQDGITGKKILRKASQAQGLKSLENLPSLNPRARSPKSVTAFRAQKKSARRMTIKSAKVFFSRPLCSTAFNRLRQDGRVF